MSLAANTKLGPYVVLSPLKSGGMGEVYRAHDPQLDRTVALKVMKAEMVGDASAVARFQREAKLASSLNHPHIISIFSTHETDGLICLAMELVEGEPLSDWQKNQKPSLGHLLEVFVQIADALSAAHTAGVIHRDLKPSNILVNNQGYAKILDFGLAKQVVPSGGEASLLSTDTYITGARDLLGTPAYMSPEQAQGNAVDARTDIFSLGVVLYEAVTGVRPFRGDSIVQLLHDVISKQPRPAREIKHALPPEIEWILERAMAKQPGDRYAKMADFAADLRRLRAKIEGEAGGIRRARAAPAKWVWVAVAAVVLLAAGSTWMLRDRFKKPKSLQVRYEQLTDFNDAASAPALSPDGRMLAFVRGGFFGGSAAAGEIYVKMLPDGDPIRLTNDGMAKNTPVFSPDGTRILYTRMGKNFAWDTWQVPVLGGEATPYLPNASGLTFVSKDEIMFAEIKSSPHMGIMTSRLNRIGQREIYMPPGEGSMAHRASLSPDRKWVLLAEMDGSGWLPCRIVPFDGSSPGRQVGPLGGQCTTVAWSPDGKWMYFSSNDGGGSHIWRQTFPDGTPEQVTSESNEQEGTTVAADGKSLVTSVGTAQSSIWIHNKQGDRQLTSQGFAMLPAMSPDGGAVYFLQRGGASRSYISGELWRLDLKSGNKERVLPGVFMAMYDLSPDGRRVVFVSSEGGSEPGIWVADLDRLKPPQQLTKGREFRAFFAGDEEIVYLSNGSERFLYAMRRDGSAKRQIGNTPVIYLINVSPDGEWAAAGVTDATGIVVKIFPVRKDAAAVQICHGCAVGFGPGRQDAPVVNWTSDGKSVMVPMRFFGMSRKTIILPFDPNHPDFDREARSETEYRALPGARIADDRDVFPAARPDEYLMSRRSATSNLFRVILPD